MRDSIAEKLREFGMTQDDETLFAAASAVLAAMREPSEAMLNAVTYVDAMPATKRTIWQQMIDAARDWAA